MKPPPFDYYRPATLPEALALLAEHEDAKVLAGGQSLMSMLNLRYIFPSVLVDINRIPGLDGIKTTAEGLRIGAMTRQRDIERHPEVIAALPIVGRALTHVGHRQTRNRGTIGGSLCHLDPAAELATMALLHEVEVEVAHAGGTRTMPIAEFVMGFMTPGIGPGEIVTAVTFPIWPGGHGFGFREFARRHGDFAIASAACLLERDRTGTIVRAAIAIGGVGAVPQRLPDGERALVGSRGEASVVAAAVAACDRLEAIGDFHGSPEYRVSVARSMLRRSLGDALGETAVAA